MSTSSLNPVRTTPTELPPNAGRAAAGIALVLVTQLMLILDATVVNVALPHIDDALHFGPASLSWVLNAYTLAFGGLLLLGGRLGDVFGRRRLLEIGLAVFTVASLVGGLAQTPEMLVLSRAAQGVGAALAAPGVLALLTTSAPDEAARNRALALFGAVSSAGMSLGLLLGGVVTDLGSWRWTLFINIPIGLAVLSLTRRLLDETPRRPGRFDLVGAASATLGAVAIVWSLIGAPEHGWLSARTVLGFVAGAALLALLARTERRVAHPMLPPVLLRSRRRVTSLAMIGLVVGGQLSMFFLAVQYIEGVLGFGPMASGLAFMPLTLGIFAMSRVTPRLLALVGPTPMLLAGSVGPERELRVAEHPQRRRHLRLRRPRSDAPQRAVGRPGVHAAHVADPDRRPDGVRRVGLGAAADLPAARRRHRPGGDRVGVRRRRGARRVPARRPGGLPHLRDLRGAGLRRRGDPAPVRPA